MKTSNQVLTLIATFVCAMFSLSAADPPALIGPPAPQYYPRTTVEIKSMTVTMRTNIAPRAVVGITYPGGTNIVNGIPFGPPGAALVHYATNLVVVGEDSLTIDYVQLEKERAQLIAIDKRENVKKRWQELKDNKEALAVGISAEHVADLLGKPNVVILHKGPTPGRGDLWQRAVFETAVNSGKEFWAIYNPTGSTNDFHFLKGDERPWPFNTLGLLFKADGTLDRWNW